MTLATAESRIPALEDNQAHLGYRAYIDGLRAIAVLSVVGFHAFPDWIFSGFVGVDIFFVISGFLISSIILMNLDRNRFSYVEFYVRRIKRIFPALILVISSCFALGWYILLPDEFTQILKHVAAGGAFVSNFALWNEAGYFDNSAHTKPLLHLWSLSIEEQFYIAWPLLVGLMWKRQWNFLAVSLAIGGCSFLANVVIVNIDPTAAFYSPWTRFWELMIGCSLAYLSLRHPTRVQTHPNILSALGMTALVIGIFAIPSGRAFPGWWALLPTVGTFLVIAAGSEAWVSKRVLASRAFVWVGIISYPLYLWHWPAFVFTRLIVGRNLHIVERLLLIVLSMVLAYLTYRFLEKPIRFGTAPNSRKVAAMLVILVVCIVSSSLLSLLGDLRPRQSSSAISTILAAAYDWDYPDGLKGKILAGTLRRAYAYNGNVAVKTLFVGDSNMEQYYPRVAELISKSPDAFNSAIFVGGQRNRCDPIYRIFLTDADACDAVREDILALAQRPDVGVVVLIFCGPAYHALLTEETGRAHLSEFIRQRVRNGKTVYLVLNMPHGDELDPKNMFTGSRLGKLVPNEEKQASFDYAAFMTKFGADRAAIAELATHSGAHVIDPLPSLCQSHQCPVFDSTGAPLYKDSMHMRASYARSSATYLDVTLRSLAVN